MVFLGSPRLLRWKRGAELMRVVDDGFDRCKLGLKGWRTGYSRSSKVRWYGT